MSPRTIPARRAPASLILACLVFGSLLAGCQAAQDVADQAAEAASKAASQATSEAASKAVGAAVTSSLSRAGVTLASPPDCTSDLQVDGVAVTANGTVDCTATTTDGKNVSAAFDGSLSLNSCIGTLTIDVEGRDPITVPRLDGCKIAAVLGGAAEGASG